MEWTTRFCVLIYQFSISLTLAVLQRQKSLLDIGRTTIQDVGCLAAMGLAMEPGFHTRSDELILQISCNIFMAFKGILMMRWDQNISHYTTAKPSVHVWNHDLVWWQNKIYIQKTFLQDYDYELKNLSKTKIPITIVKVQMPSNPNQKSRTRDNNCTMQGQNNWGNWGSPGVMKLWVAWEVLRWLMKFRELCSGGFHPKLVTPPYHDFLNVNTPPNSQNSKRR